ncbi:MAG: hypothetical protein ACXWYF_10080 [Actinomycetota bacterium]
MGHVAGQPRAATVYDTLRTASWEIGQTAAIPTEVAIGTKALIDVPGDASILRVPGIVPELSDQRYIYATPDRRPGRGDVRYRARVRGPHDRRGHR